MEETLSRIRSQRHSKLDNLQKPAIILEAVEKTLRGENAQLTPTAYYAALLTTLEQSTDSDISIITAIVYLLNVVIQDVPLPVLKTQFSKAVPFLLSIIEPRQDQAPLSRSVVGCMEYLLIAQDRNIWSQPLGKRGFSLILLSSIDSRPKVRKSAQDALINIIQHPPPPALVHPAFSTIADFQLKAINAGSSENVQTILHVLPILKQLAPMWPASHLEPLTETLLKLPSFNNTFVTSAVFEVFEQLFLKSSNVFATNNIKQVMHAIKDLQPHNNDVQLMPTWLGVVEHGFSAYARAHSEESRKEIVKFYKTIFQNYARDLPPIIKATTSCLVSLIKHSIDKSMIEEALTDNKGTTSLKQIINITESGLGFNYQSSWSHVFKCLEALYRRLGIASSQLLESALITLGVMRQDRNFELRDEADQVFGAACEGMGPKEFLRILPMNLESSSTSQPGRAWLLPLLKNHITTTSFGHFATEFIPMSDRFQKKMEACRKDGRGVEAKVYEALVEQIWALFPGYCTLPTDLASTFTRQIGELVSNKLYEKPALRPILCQGLLLLVEKTEALLRSSMDDVNMKDHFQVTRAEVEANMKLLRLYSGNFLSVFFNIFTSMLPEQRGYVSECIRAYLRITPPKKLSIAFKSVQTIFEQSFIEAKQDASNHKDSKAMETDSKDSPLSKCLNMLDLMIAMAPFLDSSDSLLVVKLCIPLLGSEDLHSAQKKSYRVLNSLVESNDGLKSIKSELSSIEQAIIESAAHVSAAAKKDRIATLHALVKLSSRDDLHIIPAILSEAILSTKEVNEKTREEAYTLLVDMGYKMKAGGKVVNSSLDTELADANATIQEYFLMVSAGLSGQTPHMISATITALSRLLFEFHGDLPSEFLEQLINTMDEFVNSANREIVKAAIGFVKVIVLSLPSQLLMPHLTHLVTGIMHWSREHKSHFKSKVRHIIERMIKKFGLVEIENRMPEEDKKLLTNIRKRKERAKRKKANRDSDEDMDEDGGDEQPKKGINQKPAMSGYEQALYGSESESSDDNDNEEVDNQRNSGNKKNRRKMGGGSTWIKQDTTREEAPLDLLGRDVASRITFTNPNGRKKHGDGKLSKGVQDGYKYTSEGKIIIPDENQDMEVDSKKKGENVERLEKFEKNAAGGDYVQSIKSADGFKHGQRNKIRFNKRGRDNEDVEMEELFDDGDKAQKKRKADRKIVQLGQEYKSSRAGGDIKKKGQAEPHSYLQLSQFYKSKNAKKDQPKISITGKGVKGKRR